MPVTSSCPTEGRDLLPGLNLPTGFLPYRSRSQECLHLAVPCTQCFPCRPPFCGDLPPRPAYALCCFPIKAVELVLYIHEGEDLFRHGGPFDALVFLACVEPLALCDQFVNLASDHIHCFFHLFSLLADPQVIFKPIDIASAHSLGYGLGFVGDFVCCGLNRSQTPGQPFRFCVSFVFPVTI